MPVEQRNLILGEDAGKIIVLTFWKEIDEGVMRCETWWVVAVPSSENHGVVLIGTEAQGRVEVDCPLNHAAHDAFANDPVYIHQHEDVGAIVFCPGKIVRPASKDISPADRILRVKIEGLARAAALVD